MSIIGVSGKIFSGKDEIGKIIQYLTSEAYKKGRDYETFKRKQTGNLDMEPYYIPAFEVKKFADKLKDIVCMLIGCTRAQLEDRSFKEKELGEEWIKYELVYSDKYQDTPYAKTFLNKGEAEIYIEEQNCVYSYNIEEIRLTPRLILQLLGTQCGRGILHPNLWVNSLMSEYKDKYSSLSIQKDGAYQVSESMWLVTDMRFPNEMKAIEDKCGITIRVNRDKYEYLPCYACQGGGCPVCNGYGTISNLVKLENEHESETALDTAEFNYVIYNNGSIEELIEKVRKILIKENII